MGTTTAVDQAQYTPGVAEKTTRPLVLIHGYSSEAKAFDTWKAIFAKRRAPSTIYVGNYISLSNEITIKDIAEGLNRALVDQNISPDSDFDAVVHSTGMLVIRSWLATYPERRRHLKHLIGLAPATYGSPLAHKGRSWLGAIFKGNRHLGADFLEAGDEVLDALELGSRFTWDLAHEDLLIEQPTFGAGSDSLVFIFVGNHPYGGLSQFVNEPGTDGTVRWSGVSLNTRKITVNLALEPGDPGRVTLGDFKLASRAPVLFVDGKNHGTIMSEPSQDLQDLVLAALDVEANGQQTPDAWWSKALAATTPATPQTQYQQFVVRVTDERGDPVVDYHTKVVAKAEGESDACQLEEFDKDVHVYGRDKSMRNFHVDVSQLHDKRWDQFDVHLTASSGSKLIGYRGFSMVETALQRLPVEDIVISLLPVLSQTDFRFFEPFTTTLIEIRLNREPLPRTGQSDLFKIGG